MFATQPYREKLNRIAGDTLLHLLPESEQRFIREQSFRFHFTFQELRQITEIAIDLAMWNEDSIAELWPVDVPSGYRDKRARSWILDSLRHQWDAKKNAPKRYPGTGALGEHRAGKPELLLRAKDRLGFGFCPVASPATRCCNLMTLDAVENCGYDCSYCSIQSFYHSNKIYFDCGFSERLRALRLDPNRIYHIGTGQSSDSLMWGNKNGVMDTLTAFARHNPNVILELKSKSKNVSYLLNNPIPANVLCSWSLNTPTIISNEEHLTAPLDDRLKAARKVADRGTLVGFHLHPMIHYNGWQRDYAALIDSVLERFLPGDVAMVSLGTLTFTKSVIKQIRARASKTKILQMPLVEASGKFSYPEAAKIDMFRFAYERFQAWHGKVFFYLCMEDPSLWMPVFGFEYNSNDTFEAAMKASYLNKIRERSLTRA